ncbi:TonB-dependent receptor domain-containing protein [Altericroceibacterium endophyticum]|uniref:TonB-dependent receptor domain-containing protein n=1 Tax=Altericroceibacterium endophyticum TaxID=1808508 RepID=UPI00136C5D6A|nr:TonB-dependent receptor [Altericroceibacterium endophyticum]
MKHYAARTDRQILFDPALVRGKRVASISVSTDELVGLQQILRGSGLEARLLDGGLILIFRPPSWHNRADTKTAPTAPIPQNIIVTALKRPSLVLETPGTVNVVTQEDIAFQNLTELRDLVKVSPSLSVIDSRNGEQRIAIRGIYGTGEATVGVYFGETPVSGPSGTTLDPSGTTPDIELVDMDRVELLSGPQGTLYGASSMGGTLRLLFKQPDMSGWSETVTSGASIAQHGDPGGKISAVLNATIIKDELAVRAVIYRSASSGFIDKPALDLTNVGSVKRRGERLILSWQPSESFALTATGFSHRLSLDDSLSWQMGAKRYQNYDSVRTPYSSRLRLGSLSVSEDIGKVRLFATVSYYKWNLLRQNDFTRVLAAQRESQAGCARLYGLDPGELCSAEAFQQYGDFVDSRLPGMLYQPMGVHSVNGEIRLQSAGDGASQWSLGAFFENRADRADSYTVRADAKSGTPVLPLDITGLRFIRTRLEQRALFGEYRFDLTDRWKFTAGLRGFFYRREAYGDVAVPNIITGTGDIAEGHFSTRASGTSLKFELSYEPHKNILLYLRASEGFRPGGVNITPGLSMDEQIYNSDKLWSYEAGTKLQMGQGSNIEASVYHVDWEDMIYFTGSPNSAFFYNANVGSVNINGLEARFNLLLAPLWSVQARLSYTDARLADSGALALGAQPGDRLPDITPFSYSFGSVWKTSLSPEISAVFQVNAKGISGTHSKFNHSFKFYEKLSSHVVFDASVSFDYRDWTIGMGIENVLNSIGATRVSSSVSSNVQLYGGEPRSYFMRITRSF